MRCFVSGVVSPLFCCIFYPQVKNIIYHAVKDAIGTLKAHESKLTRPYSSPQTAGLWRPLHYMHTAHTFHTYINKYQLHSAEYRDSVGCFEGSEGLSVGRLYIWLDGEGWISASMKEVLYRCYTVRSNLSSCFPFFFFFFWFWLTLYLRSVCLFCFHCTCKTWE